VFVLRIQLLVVLLFCCAGELCSTLEVPLFCKIVRLMNVVLLMKTWAEPDGTTTCLLCLLWLDILILPQF
jgi:hypothetical protein